LIDGFFWGVRQRFSHRLEVQFAPSFPSAADWAVWWSFLSSLFPLRQVLGRWFSRGNEFALRSALEDSVFVKSSVGWTQHRLISGSRSFRSRRYSLQGCSVDELPEGVMVTNIEERPNGLACWGGSALVPEAVYSPSETGWLGEAFGLARSLFIQDMAGVTLTICSDGSFKNDRGTASWIAVFQDKEMGEDVVVPDGVHSAYRSELAGIYGGLRFIDSIGLTSRPREVRVVCDGLSALQTSFGILPLQAGQSNLDLLQLIRKVKSSILDKGIRLTPVHVYGHADDLEVPTVLTFEETLNITMDARAKAFWTKMDRSRWPQISLGGSCVVRWEHKAVEVKELGSQILGSVLKAYWLKSKILPRTSEIDWDSFSKATRLVRRGKGVFLTKFFSGICGVDLWRRRWALTPSALCSWYETHTETTGHLWECPHPDASSLRKRHVDEVIQWIVDHGGNSRFCMTVRSILGALSTNSNVPLSSIPFAYREAVAEKTIIGWDSFLMGLWVSQWRDQLQQ